MAHSRIPWKVRSKALIQYRTCPGTRMDTGPQVQGQASAGQPLHGLQHLGRDGFLAHATAFGASAAWPR